MSTKQHNYTVKGYFNNNNKGFNAPHEVSFPKLNIKVEVYSHNLKPNKINQMESDIKEIVKNFQNISNLERSNSEKILKVYVFDDQADYKHLGSRFGFGLGDEGGKAYYRGEQDVFAEMYVYQAGEIHNLKHELAHGLTYVATKGGSLPTILMEGIADYIEHSSDQNFNTQEGFSIDEAERAIGTRNLNIDNILKLQYSENAADNSLVYKMGHALVMYLKEKGVLDDCLDAAKAGRSDYVEQLVCSNYNQEDFREWLSQHNTETAMKGMNALQVTKGEFVGTKEEIVGGEIKNVSYYKANIEKMDGESVGKFSTTLHYSGNNHLYVSNKATQDHLDLSKQYSFMKLVNHNGQEKLVYCDRNGNEYKNSQEYISQVAKVAAKHDEKVGQSLNDAKSQVGYYYNIIGQRYNYKIDSSEAKEVYEKYKHAQENFKQAEKKIVKDLSGSAKGVVEELTYFDPNQVRTTNKSFTDFEYGKVYSVHSNGASSAKQMNGVSIYDGNNKIGELLTDYGYFKSIEGSNKDAFFFGDSLMNLYTRYDNGAYIAVTKENGEFKASLIDGRAVSKDGYYDKPHLHRNELLEPSINHINKEKIDSTLLLKGTEILDHSESEAAKEHTIVKRGALLDNKGTERMDDDVYEAKIEQDDFMYTFQNKGFYIMPGGGLFIGDHGKGIRFQLPNEITHLKLVEKGGVKKLVPVTKDGNEWPNRMPSDITDEYRYIDPIFAHEYAKKDYSHKHVNIGLINFDKYKPGTMFEMRYDPSDLPQYTNDKARQLDSHRSHFTKVKLFDEHGQEVGMLSNNFHNYTDKIFFSVDYNYSYSDFLASVAPQVNIENDFDKKLGKWTKVITFDQGKGDIGGTDKGYTDYQKIYTSENQKSQSYYHNDEQMQGDQPTAYAQSRTQANNYRDYNVQYDKGQNSGARGKRTVDESDYSSKQKHINSTTEPETQKPIVLNFSIEMNNETGQHQLMLTEDSKKFARDAFGDNVQFNNLDLPENFSVWYNSGGYRYEVEIRNSNGNIIGNHPINHYGLSVEISADGSEVLDHGIYPLDVIHNPDFYKDYKEQNKYPSGLNCSEFLENIENNLLYTQAAYDASAQMYADEGAKVNMFAQMSNEVAVRERKAIDEQKHAKQEFSKKNAEFKKAINEGDIVIYRVREKANPNDDEHSSVILKMTKESQKALGISNEDDKGIKLDPTKFHITELQGDFDAGTSSFEDREYNPDTGKYIKHSYKYTFKHDPYTTKYLVKDNIDHVPYNDLFYVLNKNDPSNSGFYNLGSDKFKLPAKYLDTKSKYISDNELYSKLVSNLNKASHDHSYYDEQMQSDQPQPDKMHHKANKHHTKHEDIVLKGTILSVGKGEEVTLPNGQKIHKAEIKIEYKDIESLYNKASETEKGYVINFWHALAKKHYKIGDLPQKQYYFEGNKFIIKNKNGIELSRDEGEISLQLMHLKDHQGKDHLELVILNKADGEVIGNIHEIDNLSYGLLRSDSDILSHLEIQGHDITIHSNDYDAYLTHGLDNHVLGSHHSDHTFI